MVDALFEIDLFVPERWPIFRGSHAEPPGFIFLLPRS